MNLKESFQFQNCLKGHLMNAQRILSNTQNVVTVDTHHFRSAARPGATDEVLRDAPACDYSDRITEMVRFCSYLLGQREALSAAIDVAKKSAKVDIDSESSLNKERQSLLAVLQMMNSLKSSEQITPNGGMGYTFNNEGNQTSYRYDIKKVTTINFDRKAVKAEIGILSKESADVSKQIDQVLIETEVDYSAPFDVIDSFDDVFEHFCEVSNS